jgi:hypothetical protein
MIGHKEEWSITHLSEIAKNFRPAEYCPAYETHRLKQPITDLAQLLLNKGYRHLEINNQKRFILKMILEDSLARNSVELEARDLRDSDGWEK